MQVRKSRGSTCLAIDLTTDSREFVLSHPDTPCTDRYCLRDIPVAPDGRLDSYHARFTMALFILRLTRYHYSTEPEERGSA